LRERQVQHLTVAGATSVVIAKQPSLSPKTVETYRSTSRSQESSIALRCFNSQWN
jgi:DNA-binding CsgD family transcriptional regulator